MTFFLVNIGRHDVLCRGWIRRMPCFSSGPQTHLNYDPSVFKQLNDELKTAKLTLPDYRLLLSRFTMYIAFRCLNVWVISLANRRRFTPCWTLTRQDGGIEFFGNYSLLSLAPCLPNAPKNHAGFTGWPCLVIPRSLKVTRLLIARLKWCYRAVWSRWWIVGEHLEATPRVYLIW